VSEQEGLQKTYSVSDYMKPWIKPFEFDNDADDCDDFGDNEE
jgi:hypothetical protein